ncbi:MAG: hypothetical protein KTR30_07570 [Saprospiraceae bacterium]|nr:hypothetical protein [Saprospiraceae bacterium]
MIRNSCFIFFTLIFLACRTNPEQQTVAKEISLSQTEKILFLDSLQASTFITEDPMGGFFQEISNLDMQIQLQRPSASTREELLTDYRDLLRRDVAAFTAKEQTLLASVWQKAYADVSSIQAGLLPDTIKLVKTLAQHYGPGVYYTRGKGIIIPENELLSSNEDGLYDVMLHELFHIWSRLHPEKRKQLYSLIGFRKLPVVPRELEMNRALRSRILLNPDGIDYSYTIQLVKKDGHLVDAIPIIISSRSTYSTDQPGFFSYLSFQLFPIEKTPEDKYLVVSTEEGQAPEDLIEGSNFHSIIKDNTGYIIHPDEIMADNFVLWVKQQREQNPMELSLSEAGGRLLEQVNAVLVN